MSRPLPPEAIARLVPTSPSHESAAPCSHGDVVDVKAVLVDTDDYRAALFTAHLCAGLLARHPIDRVLRTIGNAEVLGPVLDPCGWREAAAAIAEDKALLEAAARLAAFVKKDEAPR